MLTTIRNRLITIFLPWAENRRLKRRVESLSWTIAGEMGREGDF